MIKRLIYRCCFNNLVLLMLLFQVLPAGSQISHGGRPLSVTGNTGNIPVIRMPLAELPPAPDIAGSGRAIKPLVFARTFETNISPLTDGTWTFLPDGVAIWRVAIESRGARTLNIIFSRFRLEQGARIFVYNPTGTHVLGSFDNRNNRPAGSLALSPVRGDRIIVELQVDAGTGPFGELVIGRVNHDYLGISNKISRFNSSGKCNIDINCPAGNQWQIHKNSTVMLIINGTQICTGVLVNNTENNGTPYLLTASHCIGDSSDAANTVFLFGYESPWCNGTDGPTDMSLSGSTLRATRSNLDFSLVELQDIPPRSYHPWYAGWDRSGGTPESTTSIHHPSGDVMKVAIDMDAPVTGTFGPGYTPNGHWQVENWELGATEPGSSGSPLFSKEGHLKGILTGGDARCGMAVNDFYSKFSMAWDHYEGVESRLMPWLDPAGTGDMVTGGLNPYREEALAADFRNSSAVICRDDKVVFTDFSSGDISSWQWDFGNGASPASATGSGPHPVEYTGSGIRTISLTVEGPEGLDKLEKDMEIEIIDTDLPVADFTWAEEGLTIRFTDMSQFAANYYWEFGDTGTSTAINPVNTYATEGTYIVRQLVRNRACSDTASRQVDVTPTWTDAPHDPAKLLVYPVPAIDHVMVDLGEACMTDTVIELFSSGGKSLDRQVLPAGRTIIRISMESYPPGTYILTVTSQQEKMNFKIPLIK